MRFEHPWLLPLALLPIAWVAWEWRLSTRRPGLLLKGATFLCVLLALSVPGMTVYQTKVAVAVLADTSASVTGQDLKYESGFADRLEEARGRHWSRIVPFARVTRAASGDEHPKSGWQLRHTAAAPGRGTNLEAAIRDGAAVMPAGMVPRMVLVSDGNENLGSVARGIWQAQQLGIPIDTVPLAGQTKPGLLLESVGFPGQVFTGEHFPVDVTLESPRATSAKVEMTAEGKSLGSSDVQLVAGANHLRLQATVNTVGAITLAGRVWAPGLGETRFEDAVTLRHPRVLLVSHDPADSEQHLVRTFESNQFEVVRAPNGVPDKLDDYQMIVMNNWDMASIPPARKDALEEFEKAGGGLLWIAGEHNVYVDKKGAPEDALERSLPAKLAPPRSPEGTCVILIIDKSSSMEGRKIELARLAAIGVVENLRPIDTVGGADLRQLLPVGRQPAQGGRPLRHQAADRRHHARWRHADRPGAGGGVPEDCGRHRGVQTHRAAHRRHLRRGR